jgi:hypothetical protein
VPASDTAERPREGRGRIYNLRGQESLIKTVINCLTPDSNTVVVTVWNKKAVDLLSDAGFDVIVLDGPQELTGDHLHELVLEKK